MGVAGNVYLDERWQDQNALSNFEMQYLLFPYEGCLTFLPISLIRKFHKITISKEKHTSKGMVIVHLGECPPGDQGVGCEHRTHGCRSL